MSYLAVVLLVLLSLATVALDWARHRAVTPVLLVTLSNVLWIGLNPFMWLLSPRLGTYFVTLGSLGSEVTESGVTRLLLAASCFQAGLLAVTALTPPASAALAQPGSTAPAAKGYLLSAMYRLGALNIFLGFIGVAWIGIRFDGSPLGLYDLGYGQRTEYLYDLGALAFLLDLVQYGAAILITAFILDGRRARATVVFVGVILHGTLMKSKYPILCVSCTFLVATTLSTGFRFRKPGTWVPIALAGLVIASLSYARSAKQQDLLGMFEQVEQNQEEYQATVARPWENDFPGAAAASYIIVNTEDGLDIAPLREAVLLFVPRFIYDRGPTQADEFARRYYRHYEYYSGAGMSWSMICDGFRLLGFMGCFIVGLVAAAMGLLLSRGLTSPLESRRERAIVLVSLCSFVFLLDCRLGLAGLLKATFIVVITSFVPLRWLGRRRIEQLAQSQPPTPRQVRQSWARSQ